MDNILLVDHFKVENSGFITFFYFLLAICKGNFNIKQNIWQDLLLITGQSDLCGNFID